MATIQTGKVQWKVLPGRVNDGIERNDEVGTDIQGNARLSQKHITTEFLLCVVLMQAVARRPRVGCTRRLGWLPRFP